MYVCFLEAIVFDVPYHHMMIVSVIFGPRSTVRQAGATNSGRNNKKKWKTLLGTTIRSRPRTKLKTKYETNEIKTNVQETAHLWK